MSSPDSFSRRVERLNRLRRLGLRRGAEGLSRIAPAHAARESAEVELPGETVSTPHGSAWVRTACFRLSEHPALAGWLTIPPEALAALGHNESLLTMLPDRVGFIDTETTGLSLGTDTYTFMIGVGTFERAPRCSPPAMHIDAATDDEGAFVVRQFFMRSPAEERAQLHLVEEALGNCTGIVSFNGRAFDVPLINNRFILAEMPRPLAGVPHLDLLPPARRLWRARWGSCSLGTLERSVLNLHRTAEDVPGHMIPDIYREYYRTGIATEMLARVFYHNLQDIVSMALLAAGMAHFFQPANWEAVLSGLHPLECLSLGRCYSALNWSEAGIVAYKTALAGSPEGAEQAQIMRELGELYKRLGRREEAAVLWEEWIGSVRGDDLTPYIELAKHHEWHTQDLVAARGWAAWALQMAESQLPGIARETALADLQHRLARLEAKLSRRLR